MRIDVEGLISDELGAELYELALLVPADQVIVELGSFEGKSTCYLAAGARDGSGTYVHAIDLWDDPRNTSQHRHQYGDPHHLERFYENLKAAAVGDRVYAHQQDSTRAGWAYDGDPVGLLYVDADHREDSVRRDVFAWSPHLAPGATVAFDDYGTPKNPGVEVVVRELGLPYEVRAGQLAVVRFP